MYEVKTPPKAGHGFTAAQKLLIAELILYEVNAANIDLMLDKKMPAAYRARKYDVIGGTALLETRNYSLDGKFLQTWGPAEKVPEHGFFATGYRLAKPVIRIKIGNFKMGVIKSVYAVRTILKRLGIKIQKV